MLVAQERCRVGFVVGELDAHRVNRPVLEALLGKVCGRAIVMLPSGCLGERVPGGGLVGIGFSQEHQRGTPVSLGFLVLAQVAEKDAGVSEHASLDPYQLARLAKPLPPAAEQQLCFVMHLEHVS